MDTWAELEKIIEGMLPGNYFEISFYRGTQHEYPDGGYDHNWWEIKCYSSSYEPVEVNKFDEGLTVKLVKEIKEAMDEKGLGYW